MDASEFPTLETGGDRVVGGLPMSDGLGQHGATPVGKHDPPHASVLFILPNLHKAATSIENCQLFNPTGRSASSKRRPMVRAARWLRTQRQLLPIISVVL
jgi:hypothetical protein